MWRMKKRFLRATYVSGGHKTHLVVDINFPPFDINGERILPVDVICRVDTADGRIVPTKKGILHPGRLRCTHARFFFQPAKSSESMKWMAYVMTCWSHRGLMATAWLSGFRSRLPENKVFLLSVPLIGKCRWFNDRTDICCPSLMRVDSDSKWQHR